jgi:lipoprotein signal peptidase
LRAPPATIVIASCVIDFIDIQPPGGVPWPAFNFADLYLAVGLVLCGIGLWRAYRHIGHEPAAPG